LIVQHRGDPVGIQAVGVGIMQKEIYVIEVNHIEQPLGQFLHDSIEVVTPRDGGGYLKQGPIAQASRIFWGRL
jgi:hypothetical protein